MNLKKDLKKFNKRVLGIVLSMFLITPVFASVAVSPTRIELDANKVKGNYLTTAIEVKGDSKVPMRFKVYPTYFKINENGDVNFIEKTTDTYDLSKKIRFVPSEFTVAQGKVQKVRINIPNIKQLPDGENRTMLFIEDINPKEMNIPMPVQGIGAQLVVKTRIGVPLYVDKGKFVKEADVEYMNIIKGKDGLYTETKIVTKGNSRIRYSGKVQIIQGKKLIDEYELDSVAVAHNSHYVDRTKIKTDKLQQGQYTLRMIISYFDENSKRKNIKKETILNMTTNKM